MNVSGATTGSHHVTGRGKRNRHGVTDLEVTFHTHAVIGIYRLNTSQTKGGFLCYKTYMISLNFDFYTHFFFNVSSFMNFWHKWIIG